MKKVITAVLLFAALPLFAHAGHRHNLLGTIKTVEGDRVIVTTTSGSDATVNLTKETVFKRGSELVQRSELAQGIRVSVDLANDGVTAVVVKLGPKK